MTISNWMAALALLNGTTGGIVIVLPIIGLDAGWLIIPILIFIASICCYYTATLMFMHLGKAQTINKSIMNHFASNKYCEFYNLTMFVSFFAQMILYFDLLVSESQGCLYFIGEALKPWVPYIVAGLLLILVMVTRFYHFEDNLLGYGILSMIAYAMFIAWTMLTMESGPKSLPMADGAFIDLGAAMSQGFSIHNMMIPIILRARSPQDFKKILGNPFHQARYDQLITQVRYQLKTANVFTMGAILYTFIAYGSVALVNRMPINGMGETVEDYFANSEWEIYLLRTIYIINIVTVFPEFLSISKIRFFNIFYEEDLNRGSGKMQLKEVVYTLIVVGICLAAKILRFRAPTIIELNGSVICFMEIYLIPIAIHLRCIWLSYPHADQVQYAIQHAHMQPNCKQLNLKEFHNCGETIAVANAKICCQQNNPNACSVHQQAPEPLDQDKRSRCPFHEELASNKNLRIRQLIKSIIVLSYGLFVMMYTFYTVFFRKQT